MRLNVSELNDAFIRAGIGSDVESVEPLGEFIRVPASDAKAAVRIAKTEGAYDFYIDILGVDTGEGVDVVIHLRSVEPRPFADLFIRTLLPYDGIWTSIWEDFPAAMMPERELCEMFGIKLAGHPNPKRLLTTDGLPPMLLKSSQLRSIEEVRETGSKAPVGASQITGESKDAAMLEDAEKVVQAFETEPESVTFPPDRDPFFDLHRVGTLSPDPSAKVDNDYPTSWRYARPPVDELNTEHMILNLGPQHPSMHGVMRLMLEMDGEEIQGSELIIGNLHRGIEKLCESRKFDAVGALLDRADYVSGIHQELAFALAVEEIAGIEVPERAHWLRTLIGEVIRLISYLTWFGPTGLDAGSMGGFLYVFRDREKFVDVLEESTGSRMMPNYVRPGGVANDITPKTEKMLRALLKTAEPLLLENADMMLGQDLMQMRMKNIGIMGMEEVFRWSFPGANGRAAGFDVDLRRDRPYAAYDKVEFKVPTRTEGDIWARTMVRIEDMIQSLKIIEQCLDGMPEGPHMASMPKVFRPPAGEAYGAVEGPRGEMGLYVVTDGTDKPYRVRYRSPAMLALQAAEAQISGMLLADMIMHMASVDLVFGEVDR